jgi:ElaB/YqjD/DUF883 family membrane-anchored ribosome-binding protein
MEPTGIRVDPPGADGARPFSSLLDNAQDGAHSAIDGLSGAARPAVDRLAAEAHRMVDRLVNAANSTEAAIEAGDARVNQLRSSIRGRAQSYISANPVATIGLALGAGFVLSYLIRRR